MHKIQIDLVDAEPPQALLHLGYRILMYRMELGRDEHLVAGDPAIAQRPADALLVAVGLGRVDMAISQVEGPAHGVHAGRPGGHLPDAEAEDGHLVPVREDPGAPVRREFASNCVWI